MTSSLVPAVIELRQYTLHPGERETLIELFDREFVESQELEGIEVLGQFRDIDRPDVFTWMRGFESMAARANALEAFYTGPAWRQHRDVANATMVTWDNVRLLRPVRAADDFVQARMCRADATHSIASGLLVASICTLIEPACDGFVDWFEEVLTPRLTEARGRPVATFRTEYSANTFPRLPVREGEHAFVWFARFADNAAYAAHRTLIENELQWAASVGNALSRQLVAPIETWRLTPTARSRIVPHA
jgi:quinol monooxygenase YgiN